MFKWFGKFIRKHLGITDLQNQLKITQEELTKASNELNDLNYHNNKLHEENGVLRTRINKSTAQYNALMQLVDVGIDVDATPSRYTNGPSSWAVVCLAGKVHYMKFYILGDGEMESIYRFLQPFDKANRVIDAAPHIKRFL